MPTLRSEAERKVGDSSYEICGCGTGEAPPPSNHKISINMLTLINPLRILKKGDYNHAEFPIEEGDSGKEC